MDTIHQLALDLNRILDQLQREAAGRDMRNLMAPLAWLDEANGWLRYELDRSNTTSLRDAVPFTYIPVELRK
jgi:hypothetical protein